MELIKYIGLMLLLFLIELIFGIIFFFFATKYSVLYIIFSVIVLLLIIFYIFSSKFLDKIKIKPKEEVLKEYINRIIKFSVFIIGIFVIIILYKAIASLITVLLIK